MLRHGDVTHVVYVGEVHSRRSKQIASIEVVGDTRLIQKTYRTGSFASDFLLLLLLLHHDILVCLVAVRNVATAVGVGKAPHVPIIVHHLLHLLLLHGLLLPRVIGNSRISLGMLHAVIQNSVAARVHLQLLLVLVLVLALLLSSEWIVSAGAGGGGLAGEGSLLLC